MREKYKVIFFGFLVLMAAGVLMADEAKKKIIPAEKAAYEPARILPVDEFILLASKNDTVFEEILIDELTLQYSRDIGLPARDIVLAVKTQYDFYFDQERSEPQMSVSLSKLFPVTATTLSAEYKNTPSYTSSTSSSQFTFAVSQPVARNAFGKATRLKDKIIGIEIDVARHQIIEAYEDYFSAVILSYYDWYVAYEDLKVGESSYETNLALLENIRERQKSRIAIELDVNKTTLQVLAKKEKLIELRQKYQSVLNLVEKAIRYEGDSALIPQEPDLYDNVTVDFDRDYNLFQGAGRTYQMLRLLEDKSFLEVDEEADDLLPSINLLIGYTVKGDEPDVNNENAMMYAGLSWDWSFPGQVDRAEYETARIITDKRKLTAKNAHFQLFADIKNLSLEIGRQKQLAAIADEKTALARSILKDETENYSYGKVTLNDYIDAVNVLDNNRFNKILHDSQHKKLLIEWLRITDRLISRKDIYK